MRKEVGPGTVFAVFLRLGLTSFGGPVAHLGYFREEFVARRKWLSEQDYADMVALCQFLPGPASSQVGIGVGLAKAGVMGAIAAWLAFTTPSALALALLGIGVTQEGAAIDPGLLNGLKVVAVAVVAQALWGMARTLCPDTQRATIAVAALAGALAVPTPLGQVGVIVAGGLAGFVLVARRETESRATLNIRVGRGWAVASLIAFAGLLAGLPWLSETVPAQGVAMFDSFYRSGSLVFGGGHVVLPLLKSEVVPPGWVSEELFLAGYGAAQAVPGPLFTFSAYLGAVMGPEPNDWPGALIALVAIFTPSFLLVFGLLPFWDILRGLKAIQSALAGVNAAVVGLLAAAFYDPVWTSAVRGPADFALAAAALVLLVAWRLPAWLVVIATALGGLAIGRL